MTQIPKSEDAYDARLHMYMHSICIEPTLSPTPLHFKSSLDDFVLVQYSCSFSSNIVALQLVGTAGAGPVDTDS
jgi:hypothetical protein